MTHQTITFDPEWQLLEDARTARDAFRAFGLECPTWLLAGELS